MFTRQVGPYPISFGPTWAPDDEGAGGAAIGGTPNGQGDGTQTAGGSGSGGDQNGSVAFDAEKTYAELETDTREWLQKKGLDRDPKALAKAAHNQEKLLGNAVRIPGKDATPEEKDAYAMKLGRPAKADEYEFTVPKDLPADLPYDAESAKQLKQLAFDAGLTKAQAQAMHDAFIKRGVDSFTGAQQQQTAQRQAKAQAETAKLEKLWGPLTTETARANLELADRALTLGGTDNVMVEMLTELGIMDDKKVIYDARAAMWFAKIGAALYKEDSVFRGNKDMLGNVFAEGEHFNFTKQMALVKNDPDTARSLIAAAGKKLSDFGLA